MEIRDGADPRTQQGVLLARVHEDHVGLVWGEERLELAAVLIDHCVSKRLLGKVSRVMAVTLVWYIDGGVAFGD